MPQGSHVLFQIWDVGGQSLSANMLGKYVYDAHCIVFVYDVTNAASFESITDWVSVVKRITRQQEKVSILVLYRIESFCWFGLRR